jgi:hypothetical protein
MIAPPRVTEGQCTYGQAAEAVWRAMRDRSIGPRALNVFTVGVHARRVRLVSAKVFCPNAEIGVISWIPRDYEPGVWWHSSERAGEHHQGDRCLRFEALLKPGRCFQSPPG